MSNPTRHPRSLISLISLISLACVALACASHASAQTAVTPNSGVAATGASSVPSASSVVGRDTQPAGAATQHASDADTPSATADGATEAGPTTPLGIGLEGLPYPAPVSLLPLVNAGQDVRTAYMDIAARGQPNGRTIVLLHGKNFGGFYWRRVIDVLSAQGFRVVVPDQIGFGRSSKPDLAYSFDLLAANTIALLDHLRLGSVIVLGHSMGGMLAIHLASSYPDRVQRLVLEDPIGLEDYRQHIPPQTIEARYAAQLKETPQAYRDYVAGYFAGPSQAIDWLAEPYIRLKRSAEYPRFAKASALTSQMIYQQPVLASLPRIKAPTLLIVGGKDRTAPGKAQASAAERGKLGQMPQLTRDAARAIPNARVVEIPDTGHIPHIESPEAFDRAVTAFLAPGH
ncbi:alpha/beta fold hydrolase [Chitinasiproducens palmae]|uniref:Pimeloyl-ACP methyl ester carboxylesterase n=1 Tax=Chitinasiproducens palmae TaxID=1770053 RepID=A0A1H2PVR8_9BURK|nr:alpha/beta hydrolase [Chitinasiproducens palmae]SDV51436.1 Pimeloyl-ACP methyl ester carboxylesterase [Chitinasiproducens palmae]